VATRIQDAGTKQFVEQLAVLLEADGLPRVAGRLFGVLLVSAEARSLDELAAQLRVSKASISVNARLLEQRGVVERVGRQADRRDYYRIGDDILERTLEQRIGRWRRFHETIAGARETCVIKHDVVRARLEAMDHVYQHMLDATTRALNEWRVRHGKRATQSIPTSR
jgi:predicted transcriptional regulator